MPGIHVFQLELQYLYPRQRRATILAKFDHWFSGEWTSKTWSISLTHRVYTQYIMSRDSESCIRRRSPLRSEAELNFHEHSDELLRETRRRDRKLPTPRIRLSRMHDVSFVLHLSYSYFAVFRTPGTSEGKSKFPIVLSGWKIFFFDSDDRRIAVLESNIGFSTIESLKVKERYLEKHCTRFWSLWL